MVPWSEFAHLLLQKTLLREKGVARHKQFHQQLFHRPLKGIYGCWRKRFLTFFCILDGFVLIRADQGSEKRMKNPPRFSCRLADAVSSLIGSKPLRGLLTLESTLSSKVMIRTHNHGCTLICGSRMSVAPPLKSMSL
jgi:hypothetical protein